MGGWVVVVMVVVGLDLGERVCIHASPDLVSVVPGRLKDSRGRGVVRKGAW